MDRRLITGPLQDFSHLFDDSDSSDTEYEQLFAQGYNDQAPVQTPYRRLVLGALQVGLEQLLEREAEEDSKPKRSCRRLTGTERDAALAKCGSWRRKRDPNTGMLVYYRWECGLKECPHVGCGAKRAEKLSKRVEHAASNERNIKYTHVASIEEANAIIERVNGKENYLRLPQRDGSEYLFLRTDDLIGERVYYNVVNELDWFALQNSPDGRNISGQLGKFSKEASAPDRYSVGTHSYAFDKADQETANLLELQTLVDTITYDPTTPEDVQRLINQRNFIYENKLIKAGIDFKIEEVRTFGNLSVTNWGCSIRIVLPTLVNKGLLSQAQADQFITNYEQKGRPTETDWYIEYSVNRVLQQSMPV